MENEFEKIEQDMFILNGKLTQIEEDLTYLSSLDDLLIELRRIREENERRF